MKKLVLSSKIFVSYEAHFYVRKKLQYLRNRKSSYNSSVITLPTKNHGLVRSMSWSNHFFENEFELLRTKLKELNVNKLWFQQGGATSHTSAETINFWRKIIDNGIIVKNGEVTTYLKT